MFNTVAHSLPLQPYDFRGLAIPLLKQAAIAVLGLFLLAGGIQAATSSTNSYAGAEPELLVDGAVDVAGSWWAAAGTPNWVEVDLGQSLLIGRITVAPFAGAPGQAYFYNESWKVQYRDDQGNLRNFANVVKPRGAGTLAGPGIAITNGDPGVTGSRTNFKFYEFTFNPVSTRYIRYTVTAGDRDGDSNGSELEVGQVFPAGSPVRLVGAASDPEDGALNSRISWRSNLDGALGSGRTLTVSNLKAGTHTITARVEDNNGAVSTTTTSITVIDALPETEVLNISRAGTGAGTVNSSPGGINCGSDCSQAYDKGTVVTLSATPASGSEFVGWSGTADCNDGKITMNATRNCTATFDTQSVGRFQLTVSKSGLGTGKVISSPAGINCGSDCKHTYNGSATVTLTATPASGSAFAGWSGTVDCRDGRVTMKKARNCVATFDDIRIMFGDGFESGGTGKWTASKP